MSHWRRIVLIAMLIVTVAIYVVFMTRVAAPLFAIAEAPPFEVQKGPFSAAYIFIREVGYLIIVPVYLLIGVAYVIAGPAQDELQQDRRRRRL